MFVNLLASGRYSTLLAEIARFSSGGFLFELTASESVGIFYALAEDAGFLKQRNPLKGIEAPLEEGGVKG